jgi:NDP-4-keto-2,6-dideoxyhexose 3-C-methyltransferase
MTKVINSCRVCKREELTSIMVLKNQALTGVFPKSVTDQVTTGDVEMVKCSSQDGCGLVQLRQSYDLDEMYGLNYGYRTGLNSSMVKHIQSKMHTIISSDILNEGDLVIDIGSNDSTGLQAYPKDKYELVGIDPT